MKSSILIQLTKHLQNKTLEKESTEYNACNFSIGDKKIYYRAAKLTPKKAGLFVTFWKRSTEGPIAPFHESDELDFYLVEIKDNEQNGAFLFPKAILISKGILSTESKEGKRAFRVYPPWNIKLNKTAISTQKWQLNYFYSINEALGILKK